MTAAAAGLTVPVVTLAGVADQRGVFIAVEGGDGVGKTTQLTRLGQRLRSQGREVVVTREPGASRIGPQIRALVLDGVDLDPRAEALLFAADRADHVATVIRPALRAGSVVLTDRFVDSSIAYQGVGRGLGVEAVRALSDFATGGLRPDLTIVLDLDETTRQARMRDQGQPDRIEREAAELHRRVRRAFLDLAEADPQRYVVIDAGRPIGEVTAAMAAAVDGVLG